MDCYGECPDETLISLLKEGNHEAFAEIYNRYWRGLYNAAYKRLPDREVCEDIVQNVCIDLWERRQISDIRNLPAYLHTAVRFQVFKTAARDPQQSGLLSAFDEMLVSPAHTDDYLLESEIRNLISLWIDTLPEKRREIFILHYFHQLSSGEIADRLHLSRKTVQNQLNIASKVIQEHATKALAAALIIRFLS